MLELLQNGKSLNVKCSQKIYLFFVQVVLNVGCQTLIGSVFTKNFNATNNSQKKPGQFPSIPDEVPLDLSRSSPDLAQPGPAIPCWGSRETANHDPQMKPMTQWGIKASLVIWTVLYSIKVLSGLQ